MDNTNTTNQGGDMAQPVATTTPVVPAPVLEPMAQEPVMTVGDASATVMPAPVAEAPVVEMSAPAVNATEPVANVQAPVAGDATTTQTQ